MTRVQNPTTTLHTCLLDQETTDLHFTIYEH